MGSPNGFLCHKLIPAIDERTGQRFHYLPELLSGLFKLATDRSPAEAFAAMAEQRADVRLKWSSSCPSTPWTPTASTRTSR